MSMIDVLIVVFCAMVAILVAGAWISLEIAYREIRRKWTCDLIRVPSPSIVASFDGGTIQ